MRILLASEGESDEIVAQALILRANPQGKIVPKKFPARGIQTVQRLLPDTVRAAHFGFFDLLVVHFDLDDTLSAGFSTVRDSLRWQAVNNSISENLSALKKWEEINRLGPLRHVLLAPSQAMDNWLCWGREGGNGPEWEARSRHDLKAILYGRPPIGMVEKGREYAPLLLQQMDANTEWPLSLAEFWRDLTAALVD